MALNADPSLFSCAALAPRNRTEYIQGNMKTLRATTRLSESFTALTTSFYSSWSSSYLLSTPGAAT
jgi:hypothetical protein